VAKIYRPIFFVDERLRGRGGAVRYEAK